MANAKVIELKVQCEKKKFTNDQNESFDYFAFTTKLDGQEIRLSLNKDDKKLFSYLIAKYFE